MHAEFFESQSVGARLSACAGCPWVDDTVVRERLESVGGRSPAVKGVRNALPGGIVIRFEER